MREFWPMVRRRFSPVPPRPGGPPERVIVLDEGQAPVRWIGFVGDLSPLPKRTASYSTAVRAFFEGCDLVVGNFEGVVTGRRWMPYLHKHTPAIFDELARLKPLERWVLTVANNHAADFGDDELRRSLRGLDERGIRWLGTVERPRLALEDGLTLSTWTWWVNGHSEAVARHDPGAPAEPGLHVALPHWGYEHERSPRPDQRQNVPEGYGLVVGCHSHLPQPVDRLGGRVVAWSLGNFLTGKRLPVLGEGTILKAGLAEDETGRPLLVRVQSHEILLDRSDPRYCRVHLRERED
jgi:hypothetical protein